MLTVGPSALFHVSTSCASWKPLPWTPRLARAWISHIASLTTRTSAHAARPRCRPAAAATATVGRAWLVTSLHLAQQVIDPRILAPDMPLDLIQGRGLSPESVVEPVEPAEHVRWLPRNGHVGDGAPDCGLRMVGVVSQCADRWAEALLAVAVAVDDEAAQLARVLLQRQLEAVDRGLQGAECLRQAVHLVFQPGDFVIVGVVQDPSIRVWMLLRWHQPARPWALQGSIRPRRRAQATRPVRRGDAYRRGP